MHPIRRLAFSSQHAYRDLTLRAISATSFLSGTLSPARRGYDHRVSANCAWCVRRWRECVVRKLTALWYHGMHPGARAVGWVARGMAAHEQHCL